MAGQIRTPETCEHANNVQINTISTIDTIS